MLLLRCKVAPWAQSLEGKPFFFIGGPLSRESCAWLCERRFLKRFSEMSGLQVSNNNQPMPSDKQPITVILGAGGVSLDSLRDY
jgi:hypothetical protein